MERPSQRGMKNTHRSSITLANDQEAHAMTENTAAALPPREIFPTWRIVIWALGSVGSTIIGSLAGLMTYFYVPPQTAQSDFPQYLSTQTILGITLLGFIGYIGGILVVV